ncbi:MAG: glycosyltransferase family 4 protein [Ginsengibacter sp.]
MKVLFLIPAPLNIAPSQRFRFEHYLPVLDEKGITSTIQSFWSVRAWNILFSKGHFFLKITGLITGFIRRLYIVTNLFKYDYIFIHREAAPIGPPVFEYIISKIWRKKIIYDFDDAIWLSLSSSANPQASLVKCSWKVKYICRYSTIISVGNQYLAEYARKYNKDVRVIPTVVDTEKVHRGLKNQDKIPLTIGWTGTFTNFYYLKKVSDTINELKKKYDFVYLIISNKNPQLENVEYSYKEWNFQTEIVDLLSFHIGIMPLYDEDISLGKCAFKAIQYMSLGIPSVVSPIGANCEVVKNGETGFWAATDEEWYNHLEKLILDKELRIKMGIASQKFIVENYSVKATTKLFLSLFK